MVQGVVRAAKVKYRNLVHSKMVAMNRKYMGNGKGFHEVRVVNLLFRRVYMYC